VPVNLYREGRLSLIKSAELGWAGSKWEMLLSARGECLWITQPMMLRRIS